MFEQGVVRLEQELVGLAQAVPGSVVPGVDVHRPPVGVDRSGRVLHLRKPGEGGGKGRQSTLLPSVNEKQVSSLGANLCRGRGGCDAHGGFGATPPPCLTGLHWA